MLYIHSTECIQLLTFLRIYLVKTSINLPIGYRYHHKFIPDIYTPNDVIIRNLYTQLYIYNHLKCK